MAVTIPSKEGHIGRRIAHRRFGVRSNRTPLLVLRWQRISVIAASWIYTLALLVCLRFVVHPVWGYMGFGWTPPANPGMFVATIWFAFVPTLYLPLTFRKPSGFVLWMMYLMVYVPAQIVPVFADGRATDYLYFQVSLAICFFFLCVISELPTIALRRPTLDPRLFWLAITGFTVGTYILLVSTYGLPTTIPRLGDVYSLRSDFREQSAGASVLLVYLMGWQSKVINPLLIAFGLSQKSIPMVAAGGLGQLFLYAVAGHKSVLFSGLLVITVLLGRLWGGRKLGGLASWGAASLVVVSTAVTLGLGSLVLVTLFVRRLFLLPGLLTGYYYDFFSTNPKTMNLDPISRRLFTSSYEERVPSIVGRVFFDSQEMNANAHLWADAYAALGLVGMIIVTIVFGLILWTFNSLAVRRNGSLAAMLAAVPSFNTTNSALFASIGSHGIGLALLLLWLLPESPSDEKARPLGKSGRNLGSDSGN